ncbi:MAG: HAD-IIIA family hydrolase, partial [Candidatus Eremiobacteraeota bacterium]|nr:HAD-IIIA family hydrolase [Candidatus Eremiobacteraeota bacterium]
IVARGRRIVAGARGVTHPVRPAPWSISGSLQAGNADAALMSAVHGAHWRLAAGAPRGAFRSHVATVAFAASTAGALALRRPRLAGFAGAVWALQVARFAWLRIAPGPRTWDEVTRLLLTSVAIPFAAVYHRARGSIMHGPAGARDAGGPIPVAPAVLFDRDGTLIVDVPYNTDPARVEPMPKARAAVARLRAAGVATAVVSNQGGVALGRMNEADVARVNARTEALLGPLGPVFVCMHGVEERCACRKPAPGLIETAAHALGVAPADCVVIGDIGSDVEAALAAGARSILVATTVTRPEEILAAPLVAADIDAAVSAVLNGTA